MPGSSARRVTPTYVVIELDMSDEASVEAVDDLRAGIAPPAGYTVQLTGYGPITKDSAVQSEKDLQKAELVSLPIAALILLVVFASVVAAGMPLLVAGLAIPTHAGPRLIVAQQTEMSIYVLNIATMLGPGPRHRLLAVHRQPITARSSGAGRRRGAGRRARGGHLRARPSSSAASRSPSGCPGCSGSKPPADPSIGVAGALVVLVLGRSSPSPSCRRSWACLGHGSTRCRPRPAPALRERPSHDGLEVAADAQSLGARRPRGDGTTRRACWSR